MKHLNHLLDTYQKLTACRNQFQNTLYYLTSCYEAGGKIMVCGNGGSAADSEHIVVKLMKGFILPRRLPDSVRRRLLSSGCDESILDRPQIGIPAISLVVGVAFPTAVANDVNAENIFAQQIFMLGKQEDILLAISTSGNSPNIIAICTIGKSLGIKSIGLIGKSACKLSEIVDIAIQAPYDVTQRIQEYHLAIYHALFAQLEELLFGNSIIHCKQNSIGRNIE